MTEFLRVLDPPPRPQVGNHCLDGLFQAPFLSKNKISRSSRGEAAAADVIVSQSKQTARLKASLRLKQRLWLCAMISEEEANFSERVKRSVKKKKGDKSFLYFQV